jgi:hypothetical protein
MESLNAINNPDLANDLLEKALGDKEKEIAPAKIETPNDNVVILPGGYLSTSGEIITTAEVRELTGRDEEAIAKANSLGRALLTLISRGTVLVGEEKANEKILDGLLAGDRDAILLGIYKATFGPTAEINSYCEGCTDVKTVEINIDEDIKVKSLDDPYARRFSVKGRTSEYTVALPTGVTQKELLINGDKTGSELTTTLLENTVLEINGSPVLGKAQVQNIGMADRQLIGEEIVKRNPGPQMQDVTVECPDCGSEVTVPINFGSLFRF